MSSPPRAKRASGASTGPLVSAESTACSTSSTRFWFASFSLASYFTSKGSPLASTDKEPVGWSRISFALVPADRTPPPMSPCSPADPSVRVVTSTCTPMNLATVPSASITGATVSRFQNLVPSLR